MALDPVNTDRRPPVTPQLAVRVAAMGVVAFVLFGIVFFRLWYLQVLDGDKYLAQARENRVRTERIQAPRGEIVDRDNRTIVDNRRATVVALDPRELPLAYRNAAADWGQQMTARSKRPKGKQGPRPPLPAPPPDLAQRFHRLAQVLDLGVATINSRVVSSLVQVPYADVRLRTDVVASRRNYVAEHKDLFPGVAVEQVYLRHYPDRDNAAQLLGKIGEITPDQLTERRHRGVVAGSDIGQTGLEAQYDKYLRGEDGISTIEVNAAGERRRAVKSRDPKQGEKLQLTLDLGLQQAGEDALKQAGGSNPGAFVAMDPQTGAIYAMGSLPSYNPRELNSTFSTDAAYQARFGDAAGKPLFNRATQSAYPTGSIFKPITALAALSSGVTTPTTIFNDEGCYNTGSRVGVDVACNAKGTAYGAINLVDALRVSSDAYFYDLGVKMWNKLPAQPLQDWAHKMGIGRLTGIDLPESSKGNIPSKAWVQRLNAAELACRKKTHKAACGISVMGGWNPGDNSNFAVGQGGLQATPLQMAVAYATLINGGRVPTPFLGQQIEDARGLVQKLDHPSKRKVKIDPTWRAAIMEGLHEAANEKGGTSQEVWAKDWPRARYPIFGKTGTAERGANNADQSWYVAYSYDGTPDNRPIVVVTTIEQGGFGAASAAPAARLILSKYFNVKPQLIRGSSTDQ